MVRSTALGGTASEIEVANIGHGLMLMTWLPESIPDEQAFTAIKDGIDAAGGNKVLLNSSEFYGYQLSTANLELLARFYDKYPQYAEKTVLCVKGGMIEQTLTPLATEENIRRSIDNINAKLRGTKRVDIYENARVDRARPIEETIRIMKRLVKEGKFDHIGMSECSAETLRRACAVHPIATVEIEVSPWSYEPETKKVISTAKELGISVLAYSPLGRGFLTGKIRSVDDVPLGDIRGKMERFAQENLVHNLKLVDEITALANKKGVTPAQLSLAWVLSLGDCMIPIPGSSKSSRTLENLSVSEIVLERDEINKINTIRDAFEVKGLRYPPGTPNLWGETVDTSMASHRSGE